MASDALDGFVPGDGFGSERSQQQKDTLTLYSASTDGHRADYTQVLTRILSPIFSCKSTASLYRAFKSQSVLFEMLDERAFWFIIGALLRGLLGHRTVGLFFRANECFKPGWKYVCKKIIFSIVRRWPGVQVLTILPYTLNARFSEVSTGWIYDPQLWDLSLTRCEPTKGSNLLSNEIRQHAAGRPILIAAGGQSQEKGFDLFCRIWLESDALRRTYLFVSGGRVADDLRDLARQAADRGAFIVNRPLTSQELLELYDSADMVWCCYSPVYDQASGIFGRAYQLGRPTIVRRGSYLERLAEMLPHTYFAVPFDDASACAGMFLTGAMSRRPPSTVEPDIDSLRDASLVQLLASLGVSEFSIGPAMAAIAEALRIYNDED